MKMKMKNRWETTKETFHNYIKVYTKSGKPRKLGKNPFFEKLSENLELLLMKISVLE